MILILGGAYQGKLSYAISNYNINTVHQCSENETEIDFSKDAINSFHLLLLALIRHGLDVQEYLDRNIKALENKIIISDDISSGLVPMDAELRLWRELTGRSLVRLSGCADEVVRVFCGLGVVLKSRQLLNSDMEL